MKQRLLSLSCTLLFVISMISVMAIDSQASDEPTMIDGSHLIHDDESIGYDTKITRGEDLLTGYSKCVALGPEELYVGGTTIAVQTVDDIGIGVSIERAQKGDDRWAGYTTWQKHSKNVDRVSTNKLLEVEGGYYYRVCSTHSANSDMSSSFTDGIYIEKK